MDRGELEGLDRESLVVRAQAAGIRRARILTRPELIDELLRLDPDADDAQLRRSRGFFGRARDLVARVVERGLHLPDAAERIRTITGDAPYAPPRVEPQAMPTVTLAEIYAAQGHARRAIDTLERVLEREPDHVAARTLLGRLRDDSYVPPPPPLPPEPEVEPDPMPPEAEEDLPFADAEAITDAAVVSSHLVAGPSYASADGEGDSDAAEFFLLPELPEADESNESDESDESDDAAEPEDADADAVAEDARATEPVPGTGGGHTYAIVAAADKDVDALAVTGIVPVLPEAEEPDECFAIPLAPDAAEGEGDAADADRASRQIYVRWRVSFHAIGAQLGQRPQGRLVVRAHCIEPSWDGPRITTRDEPVDVDADSALLAGLPRGSVVRVAVGWLDPAGFVPFAHSPALELATPPARAAAGAAPGLVVWTPRGLVPVALDDPRSASVAAALEASRRITSARD